MGYGGDRKFERLRISLPASVTTMVARSSERIADFPNSELGDRILSPGPSRSMPPRPTRGHGTRSRKFVARVTLIPDRDGKHPLSRALMSKGSPFCACL
jgi:hypothetical protein